MKKWIVVLFFSLLGENLLFAQTVVDSPAYEFRTTGRYRVGRVELSKQVTKLWLINEFIPGWWVEFSQKLYLEDPVTGQEYHPTELKGLKWGERKTTPECGVDTFVFTFPPLPETLKKVNWRCGPDNIYGIALRDDRQKVTPLMKIQGNWWTTDGTSRWEYGIYPRFIIAYNRFWDYQVVKESSRHVILKLTAGDDSCDLWLSLQSDGSCKIGPDKEKALVYSSEKGGPNPKEKEVCKSSDKFFQPGDTAVLQGYFRGYDPRIGFTSGVIYCEDVVANEDNPIALTLDSIGRFSVKIPLDHPMSNNYCFDRIYHSFYIEPGDTLTIYADWEDLLQAYRFRDHHFEDFKSVCYMGASAKINADLNLAKKFISSQGNIRLFEMVKEVAPVDFMKLVEHETQRFLAVLDSISVIYYFSPQTIRLMKIDIANNMGEQFFEYLSTRKGMLQQDSANAILKMPVPDHYYDFLHRLMLDDEYRLIPDRSWVLINRFEYAKPFEQVYVRIGQEKFTNCVDYIRRFRELRDSVYTNYFGLKPSFLYDVIKIRELDFLMGQMNEEDMEPVLEIVLRDIQNPYLKLRGCELMKAYFQARKQPTCPLPEGKIAGYFRKIIEPYKGKVIFMDFWATSCGPCCAGIKAMKPLRESYKGKDVVFLFITDEGSSPLGAYNKVMADVEGEKLRLTRNDYNYLQELFQFSAIPYYVIINKKGEVVNQNYYRSGYRELFDCLLAE